MKPNNSFTSAGLEIPEHLDDTEKLIWFMAFVRACGEGKGERKSSGAAAHCLRTWSQLQARVQEEADPTDPADMIALLVAKE